MNWDRHNWEIRSLKEHTSQHPPTTGHITSHKSSQGPEMGDQRLSSWDGDFTTVDFYRDLWRFTGEPPVLVGDNSWREDLVQVTRFGNGTILRIRVWGGSGWLGLRRKVIRGSTRHTSIWAGRNGDTRYHGHRSLYTESNVLRLLRNDVLDAEVDLRVKDVLL